MALSEMNYTGAGGGNYDSGTFTLPVSSDGTKTVPLPFTPKKVTIYYNGPSSYCCAILDTDISFSFSMDSLSSSGRITLGTTTNGFTISFTASDPAYWQATDAYYIAEG